LEALNFDKNTIVAKPIAKIEKNAVVYVQKLRKPIFFLCFKTIFKVSNELRNNIF